MVGTNDIRSAFLNYFGKNSHEIVPSSSLIPLNDPTLLFTNAGMVPFKNIFTGAEQSPFQRATSSQKCVRAGGKHNDLDNVGYTARHHTFFEMLGNFSFGDYFKEEAIQHAWTLLTKEYGLDKERLCVTHYHTDIEAAKLWKKISGLPDSKIISIATNDNFWSMGDTGPCGPCSEIFYDHGDHIAGGPPGSANEDGDRFVEIWNLVFMQYEQVSAGERLDLPKPSIDTGMGLERIAAVMQGTHDNFEIDLFKKLIEASEAETGTKAVGKAMASHRVIADHMRAISFLIADGILPSNEGRGYVLRRIMRRAMRHAHLLGAKDLLLHKLTKTLVGEMGAAFQELPRAEALITETLKLEESRFRQMLNKGLTLLDGEVKNLKKSEPLSGEIAFKLYDTYGFPLDLTEDALREQGRIVEKEGFNRAMEEQRAKARAAWKGSGDTATEQVWFDVYEANGATEFLGYNNTTAEGKVVALVKDGVCVDTAQKGDTVWLVANQTPFYGESGGQKGDVGIITRQGDTELQVNDCQKKIGSLIVHMCLVKSGSISIGDAADFKVDLAYRKRLAANHSATHLLHESLRRVLGAHVTQKGSLVADDKLRFDFSHTKAMTVDEMNAVEADVNARIRTNETVRTNLMQYDAALEFGAMALFGEKYADEVRVVSMGSDQTKAHNNYSVELCGGTHVTALGDIGLFALKSEGAVSSGVRRIEALTGEEARLYYKEQEGQLVAAAASLKTAPADLLERIQALLSDRKAMEKEIQTLKKKVAMGGTGGGDTTREIETINGVAFMGKVMPGIAPKDLRSLAESAKAQMKSGVIAFVSQNDGKAGLLVMVTDDLTAKINAVDLVKIGSEMLGGSGGGGRPDMAQAGGPDAEKAQEALDAIKAAL